MTNQSFAQFVLDQGIIGFFDRPLTLKSGRTSHFYVNWRRATSDAYLLDQLSEHLVRFIESEQLPCETLYGVPEGATKTALITAFKLAQRSPRFGPESHVLAMGRAKPKPHGDPTDRLFIGQPRGGTYVLEDTVTTGLSLVQCLDQLLEAGVDVRGVICLTDRCERRDDGLSVPAYLEQRYGKKLAYLPLSRAPDLLRQAVRRQKPPEALVVALAAELGMSTEELQHGLS